MIATEKVTSYLLQWRPTDDKSAFLARAGYTIENGRRLMADIREQLLQLEAELIEQTGVWPEIHDSRHPDWAKW